MIYRDRVVGRLQRRVRWAVCECLIIINWNDVRVREAQS